MPTGRKARGNDAAAAREIAVGTRRATAGKAEAVDTLAVTAAGGKPAAAARVRAAVPAAALILEWKTDG
jgi:hypothetical protein